MALHDIIVIGGSAGAIKVIKRLCADLPDDLAASVFIVVHIGQQSRNLLAGILDQVTALRVSTAEDGEAIEPGRIYIAPGDQHLLLQDGVVRLGHGPRENMSRPAIDPLFRSAAMIYGPRVIGVVLSGRLNDGSAGLASVKQCGGIAIVQHPSDAEEPEMPTRAFETCDVDFRTPAAGLGPLLARLSQEQAPPVMPVPPGIPWEVNIALGTSSTSPDLRQVADPSTFSCPACGGVLSEMHDKSPLRFRCQIGHAYTADILDKEMDGPAQEVFEVALRIIESRATLVEQMAADARRCNRLHTALEFEQRAKEYRAQAEILNQAIFKARQ